MAPRRLRWPLDGPRWPRDAPRWPQWGPRWPKLVPRHPQNDPKIAQDGPKKNLKLAPRWFQDECHATSTINTKSNTERSQKGSAEAASTLQYIVFIYETPITYIQRIICNISKIVYDKSCYVSYPMYHVSYYNFRTDCVQGGAKTSPRPIPLPHTRTNSSVHTHEHVSIIQSW
jgi:hypothetical protein